MTMTLTTWTRSSIAVAVIAAVAVLSADRLSSFVQAAQDPVAAGSADKIHAFPVQGNIWMIAGDGGNIAASIGPDGILLVDTGLSENADNVIATLQRIAPEKTLRYIINTSIDRDHVGGNARLKATGRAVVGGNFTGQVGEAARNSAWISAQENVLTRMSGAGSPFAMPSDAWPTQTYIRRKELTFNGEPVIIVAQSNAHTDGDSFVYFRKSDVIVTGDLFLTTTFPVIHADQGGSINGIIDALNTFLEIAIPKDKQEEGTYAIPGHGRLTDEADIVEYRDMVTIIRDRVADLIKKGHTLQQVKDANPAIDYAARYGASAAWPTDAFIEAVYMGLTAANGSAAAASTR